MSSLHDMKKRLKVAGGDQDGRIVKGKLDSFHSALWSSYQGEWIWFNGKQQRCLINPEKLTTEYDQKIISIDFESELHPGDVFYWNRTGKWWICYNSYDEEAYFRARIRKCEYQINVNGTDYWVWLRGPVETSINVRQKSQVEFNDLNYSLEIFITKNDETNEFFARHNIIKFDNHRWKVATVDRYSQEGILEIYLDEYFDNNMLDEMEAEEAVENTESENEIIEVTEQKEVEPYIEGEDNVGAFETDIVYSIINASEGIFFTSSKHVKIVENNEYTCKINILTGRGCTFDLIYKRDGFDDIVKTITVKSF